MTGKLYVVGIGPGLENHMTIAAQDAIESSEIIVGYKTYVEIINDLIFEKEVFSTGMTKEIDRCKKAIEFAQAGKTVSVISSGDAGIYGMAGIILELLEEEEQKIEVEIIPGVTAVNAAAATLGAPLMHDFCVISLSDLLTDWNVIEKRIEAAASADFVIGIYNPKSKGRPHNIDRAREIILKYRDKKTPVGIVRNAKRENESFVISDLENMLKEEIDMFTVVIVGNSNTYISKDKEKMITPRGYKL